MNDGTVPDPGSLWSTGDLLDTGVRADERFVRVRYGVWMLRSEWDGLGADRRHSALVLATDRSARLPDGHVYARTSAAALWGLPRVGAWPATVHTVTERVPPGRTRHVVHHRGGVAGTAVRSGVRVTTAARTLVDLARYDTVTQAVVAADYALRERLCTTDDLYREVESLRPGDRGVRRARLAVAMADGRSMSVGESLSRFQMMLLRLPRPDLQVECRDDDGLIGYVDFGWDGVVGEFDGRVKYRADLADQGCVEDVVWREKLREDRLRRQSRVVRWTWADAMDRRVLAARLASAGIHPERRLTWFDQVTA